MSADVTARANAKDAHGRIDTLVEQVGKVATSCESLRATTEAHVKECDRLRYEDSAFRVKTSATLGKLFDRWFWLMVIIAGGSLGVIGTLLMILAAIQEVI